MRQIIKNQEGGYTSYINALKDWAKQCHKTMDRLEARLCDWCLGKETTKFLCTNHQEVYDEHRWDE